MRNFFRLLRLFLPELHWLLLGALLACVSLALNIGVFTCIAALAGGATGAISLRLLATGRIVSRYTERLSTHAATFRVLARLRLWLFSRLVPLAPLQLGMSRSGDMLSQLTSDIDALDGFYLRLVIPVMLLTVTSITGLFWLAGWSLTVAGVFFVILVFWVTVLALLARSVSPHQESALQQQATLRSHTIDGIEGLGELLAAGAGHQQSAIIARSSSALVREQLCISRTSSRATVCVQLVQSGIILLLITAFWHLVQTQNITSGTLLLIVFGYIGGSELLGSASAAFMATPKLSAASSRLFALADTRPLLTEPAQPAPIIASAPITFNNVGLSYAREAMALENISFTLQPGERLALMGPSGAGKSSLALLLLKFIQPSRGSIHIAGTSLADINGDDWRAGIGYLSQHTKLIAGTLRDNLLLAKPDADESTLITALKTVELEKWLASLPMGLDTWIGEDGLQLSGGQARRVALAMVVLKNASLWLLDEPTEGLDADTAQTMLTTINSITQKRTLVLITHDETILQALGLNRLILLETGKISADTAL